MQSSLENEVFPASSEISSHLNAYDWTNTQLGPPERWPQSLKTAVYIALTSRFSLWVGCGKDLHFVYNEGFTQVLADKHPWAAGRPVREVWPEVWDVIGPMLMGVLENGEASWLEDSLLILQRKNNIPEETYFTYSYSPIKEGREIIGVFTTVAETTERVIGERRLRTLRDLGTQATAKIDSPESACHAAIETLAQAPLDIPYAALFIANDASSKIQFHKTTHPKVDTNLWPIAEVLQTGNAQIIDNLQERITIVDSHWQRPLSKAVIIPLDAMGHKKGSKGVLVAGISPLRPLDDEYLDYLNLAAGQIGTAIANAQAYEEERQRAEALAELDRAKTTFFSNVSHEFRTPLTLMLGPIEDVLNDNDIPPKVHQSLDIAHRNALRLHKLVNNLLDFSRIEAGRIQASYRATDLSVLTAELASTFRSAVEKADLQLVIDCPPLPEPVFIDRDMWEKIILNLLSNAFKHTFEGKIEVQIRYLGEQVQLTVSDTGIGIPEAELPHLFERFHRVANARSRTHEGTGIGLALVSELVKLHGGTIEVQSTVDAGTTFKINIPTGKAHLPADRIEADTMLASTALKAEAFVEEALRWLPTEPGTTSIDRQPQDTSGEIWYSIKPFSKGEKARILLADDNADMRDYVRHLLERHCTVEAVADGQTAYEAALDDPPDLILSDVMMPMMDGFELLKALRSHSNLRGIPVLLLSARAGEEARVEGLQAGADDYLTKPFTAKELLARVKANLELYRTRREAERTLLESENRFRTMADASPHFIWTLGPDGAITYLNKAGLDFFKLNHFEEFNAETWIFNLHPDDVQNTLQAVQEALTHQKLYRVEHRAKGSSDEYRWFLSTGNPSYLPDGKLFGYVGSSVDIHEHKLAEEALKRSEQRFRAMADASPLYIWIVDTDGVCSYVNKAWTDFTGRAFEEELGYGWAEVIHPDDREKGAAAFLAACKAGKPFEIEYRMRRHDGEYRSIIDTGAPVVDNNGEVTFYVGSCVDVTDFRKAIQDAEEANRRKSQFLATMSHEFRTPLNAIIGYSEMLQSGLGGSLNEKQIKYATSILSSGKHLLDMVNEILDLAKIEAGKTSLNLESINLSELMREKLTTFKPLAEKRNIHLEVDIEPGLTAITADFQRIRQILMNLLSNAIKFNKDHGSVLIRWYSDESEWAVCEIEDTGCGIPAEKIPELFTEFYQVDNSFSRRYEGTGLGLAVTKRLVKLHGGHISVQSQEGVGSTFTFKLPL